MPRFLTKIMLLDAKEDEVPFMIKVLSAKNIEVLKAIVIPSLPELKDRPYKVLTDRTRILEEENESCTSVHPMIGFAR